MDTFVDSSWYFMRYCDPKNPDAMVAGGADYWMPMDQYIGGIEHAILHLLYARFWTKVMRDLGLVKVDEPFTKLLTQGMVLNHIYSRRTAKGGKEYFWPKDVEHVHDTAGKVVGAKLIVEVDSADGLLPVGTAIDYEGVGTMSKSKNNGVDPQELIAKYGADTARIYTMFTSPPEATLEWNDSAVEGSYRFLRRVWNFGYKLVAGAKSLNDVEFGKEAKALRLEMHTVLKQVDFDYQRMQYNTVVSGAMKMINALEGFKAMDSAGAQVALIEGFGILLRCLYPATPHLSHALWSELGYASALGDLLDAPWPQVDAAALVQDEIELVLQINGKLRGAVRVPAGADKAAIEAAALASEVFVSHAAGAPAKKVIVVPGRLVNIVLRGKQNFAFETIAVTPEKGAAVASELSRYLGSMVRPVAPAAGGALPDVIVDILGETREKVIVALNASGQVREYQLRIKVRFRMRSSKGRDLIEPTDILQERDISFNESAVLAKEAEEALLYRDMQSDIVQQLLRRIAATLLELLQRDGRMSAQALSEVVNLSARATLNRIHKLEDDGHIEGYRALLARQSIGEHVSVFAEIALKDQRQATVQRFEQAMVACPEVIACYLVSGRYDYLVRLACRDLAHYRDLTNTWIDDVGLGIDKVVTSTELQTVK
eukprot:gene15665-15480_t